MAYWRPLPVKEIPIGGFTGLHENLSATTRSLKVPSTISNLIMDPPGTLTTRPGITALGSAVAATTTRGIFQYTSLDGATVQTLAQAGCVLKRWDGSAWQTIDAGTVSSITITAGGSGYATPPTVAFAGGSGTGAAGTAVLSAGAVASVTITNAGTGYITTPTVSFSGGGGSGATGTVVMTVPDVAMTGANLNDLGCLFWAGYVPRSWNGSALAVLGGTPPQGEFVCEAYGKIFVGGISTREGDLDFCDDEDPAVWTPASTNTAGSIYLSASPIKWVAKDGRISKVVIWTTTELIQLDGPETPNNPALWYPKVVGNYGTPNGRTIQYVDGTWIWLTNSVDKRGFAFWSGGETVVVEEPILTSLGLIDWSNIANACSWQDARGRYNCSVPKSGGRVVFTYDPANRQWYTGTHKDFRASGVVRVSGNDVPIAGNEVGAIYKIEGTDDAGTAIDWSVEIGPSTLGANFVNKQITRADAVMSKGATATANLSVSTTETGSYGTAKVLGPGTTFSQLAVPIPVASGDAQRSGVFRVKMNGGGTVSIHDLLLTTYQSGR